MNNVDYKIYFYFDGKLIKKVSILSGSENIWIIGSDPKSDVILEYPGVSKQHLQIIHTSEGLFFSDLNSTNGTYLNKSRINESSLKHGDIINLPNLNGISIKIRKVKQDSESISNFSIVQMLKNKKKITIGRASNCDIKLNHTTVSKYHASIYLDGLNYIIKDLNSTNGTYLNGKRISGSKVVSFEDKIFIGRHKLSLKGKSRDLINELAITAVGLEHTYNNGYKVLNKMDVAVPSQSITAIMGPSGCGKSTLLKILGGDILPSKGKVFLFDQELSSNWDYLKNQIGYVPQDDIIHQQLIVYECLFFTAKLRLKNLTNKEIDLRINKILKDLNILDKKNSLISDLSGGQRKRVSIAVELLTDPLILFLDEPTSPLDPQTIDNFLEILKMLSKNGTTVVMVTHKPEDLEYLNEVIFISDNGYMVYYGDSNNYKDYFQVNTVISVFAQISGSKAKHWISKFVNPRSLNTTSKFSRPKESSNAPFFNQLYWLTSRYFKIKLNDKWNSFLLILQAPFIAVLICLIFPKITSVVLFMIAISAIWLGAQNAIREIVVENSIYKRERMFNLRVLPYLLSKISVLSFISIIQSFLFIFILTLYYNLFPSSDPVFLHQPFYLFLWMVFVSFISILFGLSLSATVKNPERGITLLPLFLMPQILLAGIITKINSWFVELISYLTISRWSTEGFHLIQQKIKVDVPSDLASKSDWIFLENKTGVKKSSLPEDFTDNAATFLMNRYHDIYENLGALSGTLKLDIFMLCIISIILMIYTYIKIKQKDTL